MLVRNLDQAGRLLSFSETKKIKSGLVILQPGEDVGVHITENREEVIIILDGEAAIYNKADKEIVKFGQLAYIPPNQEHNVKNETDKILRYIYLVSLNN